jgi:hypothetical protein
MGTLRRLAIVLTVTVAAAAGAGAAAGDGGPSPGLAIGGSGITGRGGKLRYVAVPTEHGTLIESIRAHDGHVVRWSIIDGLLFGIPFVANDGSTGGLSRDLDTLIMASYAGPPSGTAATRFAVFDTRRFRVVRYVTLRGAYSFDALSPDASTMYLIQYTSSRNWNRYRVRAYDLERGKLLRRVIADKRESDEAMTGWPLTRVTGQDGAWVYTLYGRPSGSTFIHALDTVHRAAICIDLPWRVRTDALPRLRLAMERGRIALTQSSVRIGYVDASSFRVHSLRRPATLAR